MCNIWQQTSILVLCSSTVKEPVSSHIRVYQHHSITHMVDLHSTLPITMLYYYIKSIISKILFLKY